MLIMRSTLFAIITALLVGCTTTPDPIDHLVAFLSSPGFLKNGQSLDIQDPKLPSTASPEQLIKTVFESRALQGMVVKGMPVTSYEILEIKQVHIRDRLPPDLYTAALVRTNVGGKIFLLHYDERGRMWWIFLFEYDGQQSA